MRKVLVGLVVLAAFSAVPAAQGAPSERGEIELVAARYHRVNFVDGETTIDWCSRKSTRLLVCEATEAGTMRNGSFAPTALEELRCTSLFFAYRNLRQEVHADGLGGVTCAGWSEEPL